MIYKRSECTNFHPSPDVKLCVCLPGPFSKEIIFLTYTGVLAKLELLAMTDFWSRLARLLLQGDTAAQRRLQQIQGQRSVERPSVVENWARRSPGLVLTLLSVQEHQCGHAGSEGSTGESSLGIACRSLFCVSGKSHLSLS